MIKNNNHPTIDEILEFVNATGEIDIKQTANLVTHFYHCEKCRNLKEEILEFNERFNEMIDMIPKNKIGIQMVKIMIALEKIIGGKHYEFNPDDFIYSIEGVVSKSIEKSELYLSKLIHNNLNFDFDFGYAVPAGSRGAGQECKNDIVDENNNLNKLYLGDGNFSFSLYDDTADTHILLLIPNEDITKAKVYEMKKNNCIWSVEADINPGTYSFVIF